ncbi:MULTISPECIES: EexN family lipoprotein [Arsenophonus]|uniref:EexN family lipoprotein n=1 Tax=Arsenophonus TaxID=637 RepID=UPI00387A0A3B
MQTKNIFLFGIIISVATLIGCKEEVKTIKWYKAHPDELKTVYDKCQKTGEDTENCRNANQANFQLKQLNAPTIDFNNLED